MAQFIITVCKTESFDSIGFLLWCLLSRLARVRNDSGFDEGEDTSGLTKLEPEDDYCFGPS